MFFWSFKSRLAWKTKNWIVCANIFKHTLVIKVGNARALEILSFITNTGDVSRTINSNLLEFLSNLQLPFSFFFFFFFSWHTLFGFSSK